MNKSFRAVLFRMVSKPPVDVTPHETRFRAVLFRMVSKHVNQPTES